MSYDLVFWGSVVGLAGYVWMWVDKRNLERKLADAEARSLSRERDLARLTEHEHETRQLISMVSDSVTQGAALRNEVMGLSQAARGHLAKFEGVLDYHTAEARNILVQVAQKDEGHERLLTVLNGEVSWLRRALYNDRSHERAAENLEAERMVREADARDEAIASPMPYMGGVEVNGGAHQFSTQGRVPNPQDYEAPPMRQEPEAVASVASPVPGTE